MLTNGRITCFNSVSRPTRSRRLFSLRGSFVSYVGRNMLFYPIPQSLGCAPYVARITLARKFINDGTFFFLFLPNKKVPGVPPSHNAPAGRVKLLGVEALLFETK